MLWVTLRHHFLIAGSLKRTYNESAGRTKSLRILAGIRKGAIGVVCMRIYFHRCIPWSPPGFLRCTGAVPFLCAQQVLNKDVGYERTREH